MRPLETLRAFDAYLATRSLRLEAVVIGGVALNLLGVVSRPTKDCDILHPTLPEEVVAAARAFAREVCASGGVLADDWLNNGPSSLAKVLPSGWEDRLQTAFAGEVLLLRCPGRDDLLRSKLFALCDRGLDLGDCLALAPTAGELAALLPWVAQQDLNPDWPDHARTTFEDLARRLDHGV